MANIQLPYMDMTSILDIVEKNFNNIGLKSFAIRMIYIGEHNLPKEEFIENVNKTIVGVNSIYCDINVHGLLLVYDSYFVHIIEGSEDTVFRQLRFLFQRELDWIEEMKIKDYEAIEAAKREAEELEIPFEMTPELEPKLNRKMFNRLKMLIVYHSISTLLFDGWRGVTARPPSLIGKLNIYGPLQEHMEQLRICLDKISRLCSMSKVEDNLCFDGLPATDPKMEALPEVALLDFLIQSQYILELRQTSFLHRRVDDFVFYFESVWPLPNHFTPRHLYKLKIDDSFVEPLPVMPWELIKKEVDEDAEEKQSASSDSD